MTTGASSASNEVLVRAAGVNVKAKVRAGDGGDLVPGVKQNHNGTVVRASGMKVKTKVRAGDNGNWGNHNGTLVRV